MNGQTARGMREIGLTVCATDKAHTTTQNQSNPSQAVGKMTFTLYNIEDKKRVADSLFSLLQKFKKNY